MTKTRLDPDTLRKVIGWHEAQTVACASKYHREKKRNGSSTADVELATHERAADAFEVFLALAIAPDGATPTRLSDWVRACEGTGLGDPAWVVWDDGMRGYYQDGTIVCVDIGDGQCLGATITSESLTCSTPAELRAALERIAGERK